MNETPTLIGYIAGAIALIQIIPYIISILRGHTKPERATYAIWSLVNLLTVSSYIAAGARETIWVGVACTISQLAIFFLSFKYGMGGFNKFDIFCLVAAAAGIMVWVTTSDPVLALYFNLGIKFLGFLPTLRKAYLFPKTENTLSWIMVGFASTLNLFALTSLRPELAIFPIYAVLADCLIVFILLSAVFRTKAKYKRKLAALYRI